MTPYLRPSTLHAALQALRANGLGDDSPRLLAGGTDLYPATQNACLAGDMVDLMTLPELAGITQTPAGLRIGACTTWAAIAQANLPPALHALQQAATQVGGAQIQTVGTIGGNLCNASPAADGVPPLLAIDASVELISANGTRHLALPDFILGPRKTARTPDEILTAILIPNSALGGQSHFLKLGARAYLVISIAMVAARLTAENGKITSAALAVGACSATARRLALVEEALIGQPLDAPVIDANAVAAALSPMDDLRATAAYRTHAATELLHRAITRTCQALA
jgi:CO/xanthine dehydrogenase FAD-binding subunit